MSMFDIVDYSTGFFEAVYAFILFEAFLSRRRRIGSVFYCAGAAALGILIDISNHLFSTNMLNLTVVISVVLLFSFMYSGGMRFRLISSIFSVIISGVTEVCVLLCMSLFLNGDVDRIVDEGYLRVIGIILSKAIGLLLTLCLSKRVKSRYSYKNSGYWLLFLLTLLSVAITMNVFYRILYAGAERSLRILIYLCSAGVITTGVAMIFLYEKNIRQRAELEEEQLAQIQLRDQVKYYTDTIMAYDKLRSLRHDLNKHLFAIKAMAENGETAECIRYINSIAGDAVIGSFKYKTGNTVLDALLSSKRAEAEEAGIRFETKLKIPSSLPIQDEDICIIFGNALDNAVEACAKAEKNKYISVVMIYDGSDLTCRIENSYGGPRPPVSGTTKENRLLHGLGRKNMDRSMKKYNAVSSVQILDDVYILSIVFPNI